MDDTQNTTAMPAGTPAPFAPAEPVATPTPTPNPAPDDADLDKIKMPGEAPVAPAEPASPSQGGPAAPADVPQM